MTNIMFFIVLAFIVKRVNRLRSLLCSERRLGTFEL